jgi:hypothetical protein
VKEVGRWAVVIGGEGAGSEVVIIVGGAVVIGPGSGVLVVLRGGHGCEGVVSGEEVECSEVGQDRHRRGRESGRGLGEKLKSSSPREFFTGYNRVITCPELRGENSSVKNSNYG